MLFIVDIEVYVESFYTFDYRHKPVSRIPFPERPQWVANILCSFREFDPPVKRVYDTFPERYESRRSTYDYKKYGDYYDYYSKINRTDFDKSFEERTTYSERKYSDRRHYENKSDERKPYDRVSDSKIIYENRKYQPGDKKYNTKPEDAEYLSETKYSDSKSQSDEFKKDFRSRSSSEFICESKSNFSETTIKRSITLIEDILNSPGRFSRPPRIVIILRGPPGSGKTFLAKLIKDKEVTNKTFQFIFFRLIF